MERGIHIDVDPSFSEVLPVNDLRIVPEITLSGLERLTNEFGNIKEMHDWGSYSGATPQKGAKEKVDTFLANVLADESITREDLVTFLGKNAMRWSANAAGYGREIQERTGHTCC